MTTSIKLATKAQLEDRGISVKDHPYNAPTDGSSATSAVATVLLLGGRIVFPAGTYALSPLTVSVAGTTLFLMEGAILSFATGGASTNAFTVTAGNFSILGQGKIRGPNQGTYVADERGISMVGVSSASRLSGLTIGDGVEITGFGAQGIYAQFVDRIKIPDAYLHNNGYAGAQFLSCDHGRVGNRVRIESITPGTAGNMYGISLTHDSTNYSSDPNAGTQQALNPFCADWVVDGVYVNDIDWEGIDCHGGYDISIINNKVYNTRHGISCPTSSGAASNYAGYKNRVQGNTVDGRKPDGTVSGRENLSYGINVNGGSTTQNVGVIVAQNTIIAKGVVSSSTVGAILGEYTKGALFQNNIFKLWGGTCLALGSLSDDVTASGNIFQELASGADSTAIAIRHTGTTQRLTVSANVMTANGGTAGKIGLSVPNMTSRPTLDGNDFKAATVSEYSFNTSPGAANGSAVPVVVLMTVAATSVDVTSAAGGSEIILAVNVSSGGFTLDTIAGANSGQLITIVNIGTSSVTLSRVTSALLGSATAVIPQKGTVRLVRITNTNYEISRSLTNG